MSQEQLDSISPICCGGVAVILDLGSAMHDLELQRVLALTRILHTLTVGKMMSV